MKDILLTMITFIAIIILLTFAYYFKKKKERELKEMDKKAEKERLKTLNRIAKTFQEESNNAREAQDKFREMVREDNKKKGVYEKPQKASNSKNSNS